MCMDGLYICETIEALGIYAEPARSTGKRKRSMHATYNYALFYQVTCERLEEDVKTICLQRDRH